MTDAAIQTPCIPLALDTVEKAMSGDAPPPELTFRQQLRRYERSLIEEALRRAGGNRQQAAKLLRIPLRTLFRRIRACCVTGDGIVRDQ